MRRFWQGNHHTYIHIRCVYTVLANPTYKLAACQHLILNIGGSPTICSSAAYVFFCAYLSVSHGLAALPDPFS